MYKGNIVLLGAPGSGKGTLAKQLKDKWGYSLITTGDILRTEKNSDSEIGKQIKNLIGKGNLVPDDLINQIIQKEIPKTKEPFIIDGFPRTVTQGEFLDKITDVELVIYLEVSDETIQKRILERGKTSGREDDQSVDIIQRRIKQFKEETFPLIDFYKDKKVLTYVDGEQSISEVFDMVENILRIWS
jgi:adenylate kinase